MKNWNKLDIDPKSYRSIIKNFTNREPFSIVNENTISYFLSTYKKKKIGYIFIQDSEPSHIQCRKYLYWRSQFLYENRPRFNKYNVLNSINPIYWIYNYSNNVSDYIKKFSSEFNLEMHQFKFDFIKMEKISIIKYHEFMKAYGYKRYMFNTLLNIFYKIIYYLIINYMYIIYFILFLIIITIIIISIKLLQVKQYKYNKKYYIKTKYFLDIFNRIISFIILLTFMIYINLIGSQISYYYNYLFGHIDYYMFI